MTSIFNMSNCSTNEMTQRVLSQSWFHGTLSRDPISSFLPVSHFGTRKTAVHALANRYIRDGKDGLPEIYEVRLAACSNPIKVQDADSPDPRAWFTKLVNAGHIDDEERREVKAQLDAVSPPTMAMSDLNARLSFQNYMWQRFESDVLVYENEHEGVGDTSICLLNPKRIVILGRTTTTKSHLVMVWKSVDGRYQLVHENRKHLFV